jgi:hypothetical protein
LNDGTTIAQVTGGCTAFLLGGEVISKHAKKSTDTSMYGVLLMLGYLGFDGFTSTFQDKLFKGYKMETYNQMLYVNLTSATVRSQPPSSCAASGIRGFSRGGIWRAPRKNARMIQPNHRADASALRATQARFRHSSPSSPSGLPFQCDIDVPSAANAGMGAMCLFISCRIHLRNSQVSIFGLVTSSALFPAISFVARHPTSFMDMSLLSIAATTGQLIILYTIKEFGALLFATIMTTRQFLSYVFSLTALPHRAVRVAREILICADRPRSGFHQRRVVSITVLHPACAAPSPSLSCSHCSGLTGVRLNPEPRAASCSRASSSCTRCRSRSGPPPASSSALCTWR